MMEKTLCELFEKAIKENWEKTAFTNYEADSMKYSELAKRIKIIHSFFDMAKVNKGDKVSLLGKNSANWAAVYIATVTYGAVIVPILPDFTSEEVQHIIKHSDSSVLFAADENADDLDPDMLKELKAVVSLNDFSLNTSFPSGEDEAYIAAVKSFEGKEINEAKDFSIPNIANDSVAALIYTSGTTGFSKGVILPHNSLASNVIFAQNELPLKSGDTILSFLPIAHVFGCAFEFLYPFSIGAHITFLTKKPVPQIIMKAFSEVRPALILSVPLIIEKIYYKRIKPQVSKGMTSALMKVPGVSALIKSKVRKSLIDAFGGRFIEIIIGGAAFSPEVENFLKDIDFPFTVGYGMSECGPLISYSYWKEYVKSSVGKPVSGMEVMIDSEDPENVPGEILTRGENLMYGYYKNEEATKQSLDDEGWLHTGDLGVMDAEKNVYIRGRSKSMLLGPNGQNIYPEEIEARLNAMKYVGESIIVQRENKLVALIYPDMDIVDSEGLDEKSIEGILETTRKELNVLLPSYSKVAEVEMHPQEFEKTPKKSIKRFLYK